MRDLTPIIQFPERPQAVAIWSIYQDDSFGNLIDALDNSSVYVLNFLGFDYVSSSIYPCNYGDH